ncbi:MAG TPA: DinB family protein [Pyrinomonadaceae bacterium]|nr:DinB family protein [Pyrinomonadaceae bacterium]
MAHDSDINELLDRLARTPDEIASRIVGLSEAQLRRRKSGDEFSVVENVCHLRDLEIEGYGVRINRILAEDEPALADFDGGKIAAERDYNRQDLDSALHAFRTARTHNVQQMRKINVEGFDRIATLDGVGRITLRALLRLMREHDDGHLQTLV